MPTYHIHTVIDGRRKIAKLDAPSQAAARDQATRAGLIINAIELAPEPPQPATQTASQPTSQATSQPAPEPLITPASAPLNDPTTAEILARIHADLVMLKAHTALLEPIAACELIRKPRGTITMAVCWGLIIGVLAAAVVLLIVLVGLGNFARYSRTGG